MTTLETVAHLSDSELLDAVNAAAQGERNATARLVALLAHLDTRRLYLGEGCSSLFTYCTQVLHLSEHAAYGRIEAARSARRYPVVLDLLADGSVTLTTVTLLAPLLTPANHRALLDEARHKSKRDVEHIVARLRPQPPVAATVRNLPAPTPLVPLTAPVSTGPDSRDDLPVLPAPPLPPPRATVTPLAPERYKVQFTVSRDTHDKLRRVQDLLRHSIRTGDPAVIFDRALTVLLADLEKPRHGATANPRPARAPVSGSRHIPAAVKREVWRRDGGQCAFVGAHGRCTERGFLEFHHIRPYAGGGATVVENLGVAVPGAQHVRGGAVLRSANAAVGARGQRGIPCDCSVRTGFVADPDLRRSPVMPSHRGSSARQSRTHRGGFSRGRGIRKR